jgi:hypothetical protein
MMSALAGTSLAEWADWPLPAALPDEPPAPVAGPNAAPLPELPLAAPWSVPAAGAAAWGAPATAPAALFAELLAALLEHPASTQPHRKVPAMVPAMSARVFR